MNKLKTPRLSKLSELNRNAKFLVVAVLASIFVLAIAIIVTVQQSPKEFNNVKQIESAQQKSDKDAAAAQKSIDELNLDRQR